MQLEAVWPRHRMSAPKNKIRKNTKAYSNNVWMSRVCPRQVFNILCLRLRFSPLALATEFMRTVFLVNYFFFYLFNECRHGSWPYINKTWQFEWNEAFKRCGYFISIQQKILNCAWKFDESNMNLLFRVGSRIVSIK